MTPTRATSFLRGVGSLAMVAAVLVVPPVALSTLVGWPLPTAVPDASSLGLALRSGVSDDLIVNVLAVIVWLAWAQIAVAVAAEAAAVVRGRPSIHLPVFPGIQTTAGRLVAGIAMMTSSFTSTAAMAAPPPPVPVVAQAIVAAPTEPAPTSQAPAVPAADAPTPAVASPAATVTVQRHDSYWAIAERTLGTGYRWAEIRDLNVGRTMTTGDVVQAGSDLVHAGWILKLPADAQPTPGPTPELASTTAQVAVVPSTADAADIAAELTVEVGDNFWTLAEQQLASSDGQAPTNLEIVPYWQEMIEANRDRLVDPANPNLLMPGQRLDTPATANDITGELVAEPVALDQASVVEATEPPTPASPRRAAMPPVEADTPDPARGSLVPVGDTAPAESAEEASADQPAESAPVKIAAGMASLALAAGVTIAVRRRRRQSTHRSPQTKPVPLTDESRQLQATLIADGDVVAIGDLRRCLAGLAEAVADNNGDERPMVVQHTPDYIGVYLESASPDAPAGWKPDGDGAVWSLEADNTDANPGGEDVCAAPLLVTLGQPDDGGQLYVDLEAEGLVSLAGDQTAARGVARAMLTELALTPLADTLQVVVVGDLAPPEAVSLDHLTPAKSWGEVSEDLTAWAEQSHRALVGNDWPNAFVARGHDPHHDALSPSSSSPTSHPQPNYSRCWPPTTQPPSPSSPSAR